MGDTVLKWLLFSLFAPFISIAILAIVLVRAEVDLNFVTLLGSGQLFTISCGLAAAGLGDIALAKSTDYRKWKLICTASCVVVVIFGGLLYSFAVTDGLMQPPKDKRAGIVLNSGIMYLFTVICSGGCKVVSELKAKRKKAK
jgi:hypothetical protein